MKMIRQFKDLSVFLISVFFAMAGIYIVVAFAFIYGDQVVGWDDSVRVLMFVIVQITAAAGAFAFGLIQEDRKSTRLNSSHVAISYAVFCLKKKKHTKQCTTLL